MKAIKNINNEHVKLIVFGSVTEELKFSINELCDGNRIQYIGWAQGEQSYDFFASADLVVFPGRHSVYWEQVVGLGIPMICKHWQGTTHVDIGGNVQFIEEDSVEAIQEMIENIINNPNILLEMKQKANKTGKNQFSYRKIAEKAIGH